MMRLLFFIFAIIIIDGSEGLGVLPLREYEVVHVVDNHNTCSRHEARLCVDAFVNCFVNKKDRNRPNLFNIVPRLLDRSKACIKFASRECRPSYEGFVRIMGTVIDMIKTYSSIHLERLVRARAVTYAERDKIKDLNCIENSLTKDIYITCFDTAISTYEELLDESETYDLIFQKEVEKAIICTNIATTQCSKSVKIDLNKIVRYILGIRRPETEDIQNDSKSLGIPNPNEPGLEIRKIEQDDTDDNFEDLELSESTSHPDSTEFTVTEQEKIEVIFKIKRPSESPDFSEAESDAIKPSNFSLHSRETKTTTFIEQTTFTNTPKPEKQKSKNVTNLPSEPLITDITIPPELSKSTESPESMKLFNSSKSINPIRKDNEPQFTETPQFLKSTQPPKQNHLNSKGVDGSKDTAASENGKDILIDLSDWEKESATFTEPPQSLMNTDSPNIQNIQNSTVFNSSTDRADEETKEDIIQDLPDDEKSTTFTPLVLRTTESSNLNLRNFTNFDGTNGRVIAETEENLMIELSDEEKSITNTETTQHLMTTTESPKIKDLRNSTGLHTPKVHTAADIRKDIVTEPTVVDSEVKSTASTKHPKPSDLPKSTASRVPLKTTDFPKSTASTKDPKLRNLPKSTASTRSPKPVDPPKSTTTTSRPTSSAPVHRERENPRSRNIPFDPPRPTEAPKHWYDFIVQPIVSLWRTIKSWFGF